MRINSAALRSRVASGPSLRGSASWSWIFLNSSRRARFAGELMVAITNGLPIVVVPSVSKDHAVTGAVEPLEIIDYLVPRSEFPILARRKPEDLRRRGNLCLAVADRTQQQTKSSSNALIRVAHSSFPGVEFESRLQFIRNEKLGELLQISHRQPKSVPDNPMLCDFQVRLSVALAERVRPV